MSANAVFDSPEVVDHNVRALLEKLTTENFDSISSEIIQWANGSEDQKDGRTLLQTVHLVFENATKGTSSSEMYARLCRRIMGRINSKVRDEGIKDAEGKPIAGGQLFRKYLINRCQEAFEGLGSADATKAVEEKDALQKSKRRGPALTRFLGELFKFQMLTERIMHACINKLLGDWHDPKEEQMESLCELMTTVGPILDAPRARAHMDVHFQRMKEVMQNPSISVRLWFMLQEVLQLRERKWVARDAVATPTRAGDLFHFRDAQTNPSSSMSAQEHRVPSKEVPAQTEMNEEEAADTKITEYVKKFFDSRNLDEAESFFSTLPSQYHHTLVNNLVASVVKPKEPDARLVADLFTRARSKGLCSPDALEEGLTLAVDMIKDIDISIDASKAWSLFATMANGAQLDQEHRTRLAAKLLDGNEFLGFLSR